MSSFFELMLKNVAFNMVKIARNCGNVNECILQLIYFMECIAIKKLTSVNFNMYDENDLLSTPMTHDVHSRSFHLHGLFPRCLFVLIKELVHL